METRQKKKKDVFLTLDKITLEERAIAGNKCTLFLTVQVNSERPRSAQTSTCMCSHLVAGEEL